MNCNRCGAPLKEVKVRVPIKKWIVNEVTREPEEVWDRYEEKTEYADCPRCTGGY